MNKTTVRKIETTLGAAAFERSMAAGATTTRRDAIALLERASDEPWIGLR